MTVRQVPHGHVTDGASIEAASVQPQMCECRCWHVLLTIVIFAVYVTTAWLPRGLDTGGMHCIEREFVNGHVTDGV